MAQFNPGLDCTRPVHVPVNEGYIEEIKIPHRQYGSCRSMPYAPETIPEYFPMDRETML